MLRSLPLFALLLTACVDQVDDNEVADLDDGKADSTAKPAGVYSRTEATEGQLMELMLLPDHTFLRFEATGDYRERGTYQFTRSTNSAKHYIRFLDSDGGFWDRYTYSMHGSVVRLVRDGGEYPMFSVATGTAAWVEAVKTDWVDEAFWDWGAETFPRTGLHPTELPAAVRTIYDQVSSSMPPNEFPLIYSFDLHGRNGFEMDGGTPRVRLFDSAGKQVASGNGEGAEDFLWN